MKIVLWSISILLGIVLLWGFWQASQDFSKSIMAEEMDAMFGAGDEGDMGSSCSACEADGAEVRANANGLLAFHTGTEEAMLAYVFDNAERNNPINILQTVDRFCYTRHWMMHVGDKKQQILIDAIANVEGGVRLALEIGSYCGYSAVLIASHLPSDARLFCIEKFGEAVGWTRRLVEFAGLADKVTVIEGVVGPQTIDAIRSHFNERDGTAIDFVFIDHEKAMYKRDLEFIDNSNLMRTGSVVCADNIKSFGVIKQDYLNYVQDGSPNGRYSSSVTIDGEIEYVVEGSDDHKHVTTDAVEVSVHK
jgi:catechol O-methyltransferase